MTPEEVENLLLEAAKRNTIVAPLMKKRTIVTRRKRLSLAAWHLRIAWDHLWAVVRGR